MNSEERLKTLNIDALLGRLNTLGIRDRKFHLVDRIERISRVEDVVFVKWKREQAVGTMALVPEALHVLLGLDPDEATLRTVHCYEARDELGVGVVRALPGTRFHALLNRTCIPLPPKVKTCQ